MAEISSTEPVLDLKDRTVIVTGGSKGIGKIYSQQLAKAGAKVVIADIDAEQSDKLADDIATAGGQVLSCPTDVSDQAATENMAKATLDAFGRIDGLVNNASLMSVLPRQPWHQIKADDWDRVMEVNLKGIFLCCLAVYSQMKKQGKGKIVNISSSRVWAGNPDRLHYTTSKMGVIGLTRALAREVGDDNIAVNAISPGFTLSETQIASSSNQYLSTDRDQAKCFKRPQVPDDLVGALMFLLSDASNYITGQTLNVDGGRSMH